MKRVLSLVWLTSPKIEDCDSIFSSTLLTISPRYIPEINFSKIWKQATVKLCKQRFLLTRIRGIIVHVFLSNLPVPLGLSSPHPGLDHILWLGGRTNRSYPILCLSPEMQKAWSEHCKKQAGNPVLSTQVTWMKWEILSRHPTLPCFLIWVILPPTSVWRLPLQHTQHLSLCLISHQWRHPRHCTDPQPVSQQYRWSEAWNCIVSPKS